MKTTATIKKSDSLVKNISLTGFIAGTLDIMTAMILFYINTGNDPQIVLKYISSAILGPQAFKEGLEIVFLGLVLHYIIAYSFTILFFMLYPKISFLSKNKYVSGIVYGVIIWMIMNLAIVPFSRANQAPFDLKGVITGVLIIILMVGLPVSIMANRYYRK